MRIRKYAIENGLTFENNKKLCSFSVVSSAVAYPNPCIYVNELAEERSLVQRQTGDMEVEKTEMEIET